MPQASHELREAIGQHFGNVSMDGPVGFLFGHWFKLFNWHWIKPMPSHTVSTMEAACISFLCTEFDFGGLI